MPTALVVDDSRAMRRTICRVLVELGFEVSEAGDGAEALTVLAEGSTPTVVLVDWNMPGMNGLELVRRVRAEPSGDAMRILMVTSETEPAQMVRALAAGVDEYVMKPFTAEGLVEKLAIVGVRTG